MNTEEISKLYIEAWSSEDEDKRRSAIEALYSKEAVFYAEEPGDKPLIVKGVLNIHNHVSEVYQRVSSAQFLNTELISFNKNHNMLKISWLMKNKSDYVVINGTSVLILDGHNKIIEDYIFIA